MRNVMDTITTFTDGYHLWVVISCLALAIPVVLFLKKRTVQPSSSSQIKRMESMSSKYMRKLSPFESVLYELNSNIIGINCYMATVESNVPLNLNLLEEAARVLQRRHPLFQVRIHEDEELHHGRSYYFVPMEDLIVDVNEISSACWEDVHATETKTKFDFSRGPLWRMRLLNCDEQKRSEDGVYRNTIATTFCHAIVDGNCIMRVLNELMDILSALSNGDDVNTTCYPRLPSIEDLFEIRESPWWRKILAKSLFKVTELLTSKKKKLNPYIECFQAEISRNPSVVKETRALSIEFTEDEVKKLRNICRQHGSTVNGATTAAASIAVCKIMQGGKLMNDQKIQTTFAVNMRNYCHPMPEPDKSVGLYCSILELDVVVPKDCSTSSGFWKLAAMCTKETRNKCQDGCKDGRKFLEMVSLVKKVLKLSTMDFIGDVVANKENAGRTDALFLMSNLGDCSYFTKDKPRKFELVRKVSACSGFNWEPAFAHYIATVHGKMFWSLAYHTNVCTKTQAMQYADAIEEVLRMVING
ncbi:uncharacterized protein [Ptychodera flava]|uniref:uncharacterized protein n=1 Tax=Ptychodera flava TaxID=63121 RepID=UPI003969BF01